MMRGRRWSLRLQRYGERGHHDDEEQGNRWKSWNNSSGFLECTDKSNRVAKPSKNYQKNSKTPKLLKNTKKNSKTPKLPKNTNKNSKNNKNTKNNRVGNQTDTPTMEISDSHRRKAWVFANNDRETIKHLEFLYWTIIKQPGRKKRQEETKTHRHTKWQQ